MKMEQEQIDRYI
jgi:protein phosphatase PTC2/3